MADTKITVKVGPIEFSGEGEDKWLAAQLDKILEKAPKLASIAPVPTVGGGGAPHIPMSADANVAQQTLAAYLKAKGATKNQVRKFLAAAVWLEAKGKSRLSTADVTKALKDSNQSRLGNPSDCLNQNIGKGYCERDGKVFYVTQEGKDSL